MNGRPYSKPKDILKSSTASMDELRFDIETMLNARLEGMGKAHDTLEQRVYVLEGSIPQQFQQRLESLEQLIQPYKEYESRAQTAVQTLAAVESRFKGLMVEESAEIANIKTLRTTVDRLISELDRLKSAHDSLAKKIDKVEKVEKLVEIVVNQTKSAQDDASMTMNKLSKRIDSSLVEGNSGLQILNGDMSGLAESLEAESDRENVTRGNQNAAFGGMDVSAEDNLEKIDSLNLKLRKAQSLPFVQAERDATMQRLVQRVQILEDRTVECSHPSIQSLSIDDLARTLLSRVRHGEVLAADLVVQLRTFTDPEAIEKIVHQDANHEHTSQAKKSTLGQEAQAFLTAPSPSQYRSARTRAAATSEDREPQMNTIRSNSPQESAWSGQVAHDKTRSQFASSTTAPILANALTPTLVSPRLRDTTVRKSEQSVRSVQNLSTRKANGTAYQHTLSTPDASVTVPHTTRSTPEIAPKRKRGRPPLAKTTARKEARMSQALDTAEMAGQEGVKGDEQEEPDGEEELRRQARRTSRTHKPTARLCEFRAGMRHLLSSSPS